MSKKRRFTIRSKFVAMIPMMLIVLLPRSLVLAADIYVSAVVDDQGVLRILTKGGREIVPMKEPEQVGFSKPQISEDGRVVGWLAEFPNCCTSYPIPLKLVIYSNDRRHTLTGIGLAVSRWAFQAGGKRVAFEQETVHGGLGVHYELRDVATGRLIAEYGPKMGADNQALPDQHVPKWVQQLDSKR
jgi:hypothetical protein